MKTFGQLILESGRSSIENYETGSKELAKLQEITDRARSIQSKHFGVDVIEKSGSTDCNIPHSKGIPAVALAAYDGAGTHTREEWVVRESFKPGLRVAMELMLTEGGLL